MTADLIEGGTRTEFSYSTGKHYLAMEYKPITIPRPEGRVRTETAANPAKICGLFR